MTSTASEGKSFSESPPGGLPRIVEVVLALFFVVALSPLILVLAVAIRMTSVGPAFFRQRRVGRDGRRFDLVKLRTMSDRPGSSVTAAGDLRITALGRWLRRFKLDELPGIWNVLRGDLSWVGPRPEVPEFVDLEDPRWQGVLRSRPGLTDSVTLMLRDEEAILASILASGLHEDANAAYREVLLPRKMELWLQAQRERSAWTDLRILAATVGAALGVRGRAIGTMDELDRRVEPLEP